MPRVAKGYIEQLPSGSFRVSVYVGTDLLYRGGEPRDLGATVRQWDDLAAMSERAFEEVRAAGPGGVGYFLDAVAAGRR